ncbi:MAG: hypothetical protein K2N34_06825 [Lachnospiraceae bacterium]|nr:hypothetical protein [Lachnospiraceae bacterium]
MEKKKTGFIAAISVLSVIVCVLVGAVVFLIVDRNNGNGSNTTQQKKESGKNKENGGSEIFKNKVSDGDDEDEESGEYKVVLDGYKFTVPSPYSCMIVDGIGTIIYLDDIFQMKLVIRDGSYEKSMKNPDSLTEATIEAGGKVTQDVKETKINGQKYAYFRIDLDGDEQFVVITQALDKEQRFAGQIAVLSEEATDKNLLNVFAEIISSAEKTDEPDTTEEDLLEQKRKMSIGEKKKESTLSYGGNTITYKVPGEFYSEEQREEKGFYAVEDFVTEDRAVEVTTMLMQNGNASAENEEVILDWENAKKYIESESDRDKTYDVSDIKTVKKNGYEFYYVIIKYEHKGVSNQQIYAACDIGDNGIYAINAAASDWKETLTLDTIEEFLSVEEEK